MTDRISVRMTSDFDHIQRNVAAVIQLREQLQTILRLNGALAGVGAWVVVIVRRKWTPFAIVYWPINDPVRDRAQRCTLAPDPECIAFYAFFIGPPLRWAERTNQELLTALSMITATMTKYNSDLSMNLYTVMAAWC